MGVVWNNVVAGAVITLLGLVATGMLMVTATSRRVTASPSRKAVRAPREGCPHLPRPGGSQEVADLFGIPRLADVFRDTAKRPMRIPRLVPLVRASGGQPLHVQVRQPRQALFRFVQVRFGEGGPVAGHRHGTATPFVRPAGMPAEQSFDLGEVVDQVVGVPTNRLVWCVETLAALSQPRPPVPCQPGPGEYEDPFDAGDDDLTWVGVGVGVLGHAVTVGVARFGTDRSMLIGL
ncbi:MAG: SPW repeat protein [Kutzneria sp.]|nr:SPW repeat protein [Kutzneria sp.]